MFRSCITVSLSGTVGQSVRVFDAPQVKDEEEACGCTSLMLQLLLASSPDFTCDGGRVGCVAITRRVFACLLAFGRLHNKFEDHHGKNLATFYSR